MDSLSELIRQGSASIWLFIPTAILLGALHGLEPGHSKTMMAAFIVAIRGTVWQAVLLGLSAAISHSLIIWILAAGALHFGSQWDAESVEPYLQIGSAAVIFALAVWMYFRTRRDVQSAQQHHHSRAHSHDHAHSHSHDHHHDEHGHDHAHEHDHHHHNESIAFEDAHEQAHASDIQQRFAGRTVTTPQIVLFGITGGLLPCPAAFTVLLICLQLKRVALGFAMVAAFSFGLAVTMVTVGVVAALSVRHAERRFRGFGEAMRRAPYISCALLTLLASYMAWHGWSQLHH